MRQPTEDEVWAKKNEATQLFSPRAPIDEKDLFAGRIEQIEDVMAAVNQRGEHVIIFGERGVGKTSLVNILPKVLHHPPFGIITARVNCVSTDTFEGLWRKALLDIGQVSEGEDGQDVVTPLASVLDEDCSPDAIRRALSTLSLNNVVVIIFDEFDRINDDAIKSLFSDTIKSLSDYSVSATVILVGVADSVTDLIREHESVGRALVQIPMPRMSKPELDEIVSKRIELLGMTMDPGVLDQISMLAQGLPHYSHLIGMHTTIQALNDLKLDVGPDHLDNSIRVCIEKSQQSIRDKFYKATVSPRGESLYKHVLYACALAPTDDFGYFTAATIRDPMSKIMGKRMEIPSFSRHLKAFGSEERGPILQISGRERKFRFRFVDPLMQPYVTMHGYKDNYITRQMLYEASASRTPGAAALL